MKKSYTLLVCCFLILSTTAQKAGISFVKRYGGPADDRFGDMTRLVNGNYVAVGYTASTTGDGSGNHGGKDFLIKCVTEGGRSVWTRVVGGSVDDGGFGEYISATADGGFFFVGSTSSPDGDIPLLRGSWDILVVKFDRDGNITWKKTYGGTGTEFVASVESTVDGGCIIASSTDTDNNGDIPAIHGVSKADVWVLKLDAGGTVQWSKVYGGSQNESCTDIKGTADGGFVITANVQSIDGDLTGTVPPGAVRATDVWIFKIDNSGNLVWNRRIGGSANDDRGKILVSTTGDIYVLSGSESNDGDIPGNFGLSDILFIKLSSAGNISFIKTIGGGAVDAGSDLLETSDGNILIMGLTYSLWQVNGNTIFNKGGSDVLLIKTDRSNGNTIWLTTIAGSANDFPYKIIASNDRGYVIAGNTASNDFDFPNSLGGVDAFLVKIDALNVIRGTLFYDYNGNNTKDSFEPVVDNILVTSAKVDGYSVSSFAYNGSYENEVDSGNFFTQPRILNTNYYTITPTSFPTNFPSYYGTASGNFAVRPVPGKRDLRVYLLALNPARGGFRSVYQLICYNVGTDTVASGSMRLMKPGLTRYVSSIPAATVNGDTLSWQFSNLKPLDTLSFQFSVDVDQSVRRDDWLRYSAVAEPIVNDLRPGDNRIILFHIATGSYDPNDKLESHGGFYSNKDLESKEYLNYTIRFQNTGNDTAFTVVIRDTLDSKLDLTSFEMLASSHKAKTTITNNIVTWTFNDILLVDSNRNEPASHGYLSFRIKPTDAVQLGDTIRNSASIYFDFNEPIKTNTNETVVKIPMAPDPEIGYLKSTTCTADPIQKIKILNTPNGDYQATVTAAIDGTPVLIGADSTVSINAAALTTGNHVLTISYTNSTATVKLNRMFSVVATVTPEVNVIANITNVVNLQDMVIVSAVQPAGAGTAPVYAFAKDRGFTTLLRAESGKDSIHINPASLNVGNNWIYLRMKTSEACYTAQTSIDSINITRSSVTGIADPFDPLNIIIAAPNPFNDELTIRFANPSPLPTYIELYDGIGRLILWRAVRGQNLVTIIPKMNAGPAYLVLYNYKKQIIGTLPLIKR